MPAVSGVVLKCAQDGQSATEICTACDLPVCEACVVRREAAEIVCRPCEIEEVLAATLARAEELRLAALQSEIVSDPKRFAGRRRVAAIAVLVVCVPAFAFFQAPKVKASFDAPVPYSLGDVKADGAPGLTEALDGLWRVRAAMDVYLVQNAGVVPKSLFLLDGAPEACPGCGSPWVFKRTAKSWEVSCPKPSSHARSSIVLDSRYGPPFVSADAGRKQ